VGHLTPNLRTSVLGVVKLVMSMSTSVHLVIDTSAYTITSATCTEKSVLINS